MGKIATTESIQQTFKLIKKIGEKTMGEITVTEIEDLKYILNKIDDEKYLRMLNIMIGAFNVRHRQGIQDFFELCEDLGILHAPKQQQIKTYRHYLTLELNKIMKDPLYDVLSLMFELNRKNRQQQIRSRDFSSTENYLKEYGTIKFDVGRQIGKTTVAFKLLNDYLDHGKSAVIVVPKENMKYSYKDLIKGKGFKAQNELTKHILSFSELTSNEGMKRILAQQLQPDLIIIDEASFTKDLDFIYQVFGKDKDKTFLLLG